MKHLLLLFCGLLLLSCSGGEQNEPASDSTLPDNTEFEEFLSLFDDITPLLGTEEEIVFPLDQDAHDSLITKLPPPIPGKFASYIHMEDTAFKIYNSTLAQFTEERPFYPIYKIRKEKFDAVIIYYTVPEVPRQRVMGEHYLLFTYNKQGVLTGAYPLAFWGCYQDPFSRYAKFRNLNHVEIVTRHSGTDTEFSNGIVINDTGKIEGSIDRLHYEDHATEWVLANMDKQGNITALKHCDKWQEEIKMYVDENLKPILYHYSGQEGRIYKVSNFRTSADDPRMTFYIKEDVSPAGSAGYFYYDDPEHITLRIKGLYFFNESLDKEEILFVKKDAAENGSIKTDVVPCEEVTH